VVGIAGPERLEIYTADGLRLELGPVTVDGVKLVVHESGTLAVRTPLALAGASVLSRLGRMTLDPFDRLLWIGVRE
ncbi:MAG: hypothetical protein HY720_17605, partial [Planctomycetes bacterium]|nr:hypothetical protein [Planctomycetota bacterium]